MEAHASCRPLNRDGALVDPLIFRDVHRPKWCTAELGRLPGRRCAWLRMRFGREYPHLMGAASFYSLKRKFLRGT